MVSFDMDDAPDLLARAKRDQLIVAMTGRRPTPEYIEKTYDIELAEEEAAMPEEPPMPPGNTGEPEFAEGDEDVLPGLVTKTREAAGPKFDALVAEARVALGTASSLTEFRLWTMHRTLASRDELVEALTPALAAAWLAGYASAEDDSPAFAEDDEGAYLPFKEQIDFFRAKLSIGTERWTDIWQKNHDIAFVVAGASEAGLLRDLRTAVDSAIAEGTTLATFQKEFDKIVKKHGWDYKGDRDWRTEVIYRTNLRSSYAAGRYAQMQAVKKQRPYWRYRHSHLSAEPRETHLAWDNLILHADNPWWDTHYPPNGWGCKCYVETLRKEDLERLGKTGPDRAPTTTTYEWTDKNTGEVHEVPTGIDPGWAYAPGKAAFNREADYIAEHRRYNDKHPRNDTYEKLLDSALEKHRANNLPDFHLSEAEKVAIYEYTTDNDFIAHFNHLQRSAPKQTLNEYGGFIATLNSALNKLPPHKGQVWRGSGLLPEEVMDELKEGRLYTPRYFWSSSLDKKLAAKGYDAEILFDIKSKNGKNIQLMSAKPHEEEVLFAADAVFRVESKKWDDEEGWWEIKLTEI